MSAGSSQALSSFDAVARKLIIQLSRTYVNNTANPVEIKESGMSLSSYNSGTLLYVRDVLDASITIPIGNSIIWVYHVEVAYPA